MDNSNKQLVYYTSWFDGSGWRTNTTPSKTPIANVKAIIGREYDRERFELELWEGKSVLISEDFSTVNVDE